MDQVDLRSLATLSEHLKRSASEGTALSENFVSTTISALNLAVRLFHPRNTHLDILVQRSNAHYLLQQATEARNFDLLNAQVYSIQLAFNTFFKLLLSESGESNPQDPEVLASWQPLLGSLFQQGFELLNLATSAQVPNATQFAIHKCLYAISRPSYSLWAEIASDNALELEAEHFCEKGVVPFILSTLANTSTLSSTASILSTSSVLQLANSILKLQLDDAEHRFAARLTSNFSPGSPLYEHLASFQRALSLQASPSSFGALMPPVLSLIKLSIRSPYFETPIPLLQEIILPSILDDDDNIRDPFVARKMLALLSLEQEATSHPRSRVEYLTLSCRLIPVIFHSIAPRAKLSNSNPSRQSLVATRYSSPNACPVADQRDLEALQRTAVVFTLKVCGTLMESLEYDDEAELEHLVSLGRIVSAKGLFSLNPTASFFHLFGDHDPQLLEALYWLQLILSRMQTHSSSKLVRELFSKIPPLAPFLSVLNPYSLFAEFLSFLHHDHSVLIDFMLSSESEKFLRYLLGFVKICLADWNRAFFTLYNLKRKKSSQDGATSKALSSQEVDDLLERLLAKVSLDADDDDGEEDDEESEDVDEIDEEDGEGAHIDSMLLSSADYETEFDATISTLIRLRVHLEHAVQKDLLTYNVQPLMTRLLEIETKYERQGEEE